MANPGVGSKFVSVNLNKSYGQRSNSSGNLGGANRVRSGGGNGVGGGTASGGGMVVLSRSRSSIVGVQKGGPKLSVPPPLNLPSLRKEHERYDSSSSAGGSAGAGNSGPGARPSSSGIGWTKPAPLVLQENDSGNDHPLFERAGVGSPRVNNTDPSSRTSRTNSVYMPPSARSGMTGPSVATPTHDFPPVHRAVVLRGEDFPSLQATLPTTSAVAQKQKDNMNQKKNQKASDEPDEQLENSYLRPPSGIQSHSSQLAGQHLGNRDGVNDRSVGSRSSEQSRKQADFFPSPFPLVRFNHASDWADDERDTGHGITYHDRDQGYSRSEFPWDRDFDFPRTSVPPRTSNYDHSEGRGLRNDEIGRPPPGGFPRGKTYNRDIRSPSKDSREGTSWRAPAHMNDGFNGDKTGTGARPHGTTNRENAKDTKHGQSPFGNSGSDGFSSGFPGSQDSRFGRRDMAYGQGNRQTGNNVADPYNGRGNEQTNPYGGDLPNRHRGESFQNGSFAKALSKGHFVNDPNFNVSRDRHLTNGKQYMDEPFLKDFGVGSDFDGRDPLTGSLVGVLRKKKDVLKQVEFHDPARESFEAELERVQKLQEQERKRVIEEQERAMEIARKEEEERERLVREEEERRRRLEEEAREAAWRAEQERFEAVRRAEEQRVTREEEKRRMLLEEERRKEAARKKLLELEERIARRQAENEFSSTIRDEKLHGNVQEKESSKVADVVDWEDGERMVERITSSASSDSSSLNRSFEVNSRSHFYGDGDSAFMDRGKPSNSWRRDVFDNGSSSAFIWQDQDNGYRSPKRDAYGVGRSVARKEHGGPGFMPVKPSGRGGIPEHPLIDNFSYPRSNRLNLGRDEDPYNRNADVDPEFHDNFGDKFSSDGWGMGRTRASHNGSYSERIYQNSDADGFSSFGKSRHSMRQPRVLPPPSLTAMNKNTFRSQIESPTSSAFLDSGVSCDHAPRTSEPNTQTRYEASYLEEVPQPRMVDSQKENTSSQDQSGANTATSRCDSQSSLSVSSPPTSPTHLSHDDMEDSGESPRLPTAAEGEEVQFSDNYHAVSVAEVSTSSKMGVSSSISPLEDDEWDIENHQGLTEQEEYDEEDNGYREEDEVHEGDEEDINLPQEFEDLHLEGKDSTRNKDQVVSSLDKSVDVVMPTGDDIEGRSINGEKTVGPHLVSPDVSNEVGSLDGLVGSGQSFQSGNDSPKMNVESSSVIQEFDRSYADLDNKPVSDVYSSDVSADLMESIEASNTSTLTPQQPPSPDMAFSSSSIQPTMSTMSASASQTEVPVKLQFGLFSGPSLIPSPVPAIQIGSIQMPLHLHHQGPPLTQMPTPQPPFFQFGQLRYASSPISQGLLPLGPQAMSFVQPSVPGQYPFNQNQNGLLTNQGHSASIQNSSARDRQGAASVNDHVGVQKLSDKSQPDPCKDAMVSHSRADSSRLSERNIRSGPTSQVEPGYQYFDGKKSYRSNVKSKESQSPYHAESSTSQFISKAPGPVSGSKGKRGVYTVKNSGPRSSFPVSESLHTDARGYQKRSRPKFPRTEFRVRENVDKRQTEFLASFNNDESEKSTFVQNGAKETTVNKPSRQMVDAEGMNSESINARGERKVETQLHGEAPAKKVTSLYTAHSKEGSPKRNFSFDEDVDAPLQSGIVRVFKQPGIEAPSDEDDFIEVRSKRQMLNDRREQREKEIKARSRIIKAPRRHRSVSQNNVASTNSNKPSSLGGASSSNYSKSAATHGQNLERSMRFTNSVISPPLAPIGTPSVNLDAQADKRTHTTKSPQTGPIPVISTNGTSLVPSLPYENNNMFPDSVPTSLNPWGNTRINQQVMALTQTQLDEAMKPARFEKHVTSVIEPNKHSSSIATPDKTFSSTASPLNSLLAGEKIQFGAVTSPTILPPTSHITSNSLSELENDCSLFYDKEKHLNESCVDLIDSEAEAEAAASAVAVAAISNDETVGSGCSVSVSETKNFGGAEKEGLVSEGGVSDQQLGSQSRVEESLSVALPADLSVETPALSLWPSLPSPSQHSAGQMLSHFPGGPPSHFPCYEMNPMLGPPIFAYGPHDETAGTQSQKSSTPVSGPHGAWQQCHSGVDSFYGPPAGFTGPFISPSGGISGVQGPPHMVVYNHFTPVGQFGQVGLSFMGATYIPSGKQPDWKHIPSSSSSAMGIGDGDMNNNNNPNMPQIQHLAPGSPLLPMPMFDMSSFQSSEAARWSHYSGPPIHSMPMPQHSEGVVLPSQFSHGSSIDQTSDSSRFHELPYSSAPPSDNNVTQQFPDELGLTETPTTTTATSTSQVSSIRPSAPPPSYCSTIQSGGSNNNINNSSSNQSKTTSSQQQYLHPSNTGYPQNRRGFHGRTQSSSSSSGTDKKISHSKVKQIYVAKAPASNVSS